MGFPQDYGELIHPPRASLSVLASSQTILNGRLGLSSGGEKLMLFLPLIRTRENPGSAGACGCHRPSGFGVQGCTYLISGL